MFKRIIAAFSALCLAAGLVPLPAFAAGDQPEEPDGAGSLVAASVGAAGSYYVAMDGNDSNPGTIEKPF